jgi:hypothetical protein
MILSLWGFLVTCLPPCLVGAGLGRQIEKLTLWVRSQTFAGAPCSSARNRDRLRPLLGVWIDMPFVVSSTLGRTGRLFGVSRELSAHKEKSGLLNEPNTAGRQMLRIPRPFSLNAPKWILQVVTGIQPDPNFLISSSPMSTTQTHYVIVANVCTMLITM